ncbi:hypothetical protein [Oryza sativa Japonica Group]|uniref:Uncharacterized protein n=1 Tax=Oryza sativa subsp. japonica TaxID=39947 RepID=Q658D2_ORYSJ|nr:hypothetical protein [Oryza sativa Japonica Group]
MAELTGGWCRVGSGGGIRRRRGGRGSPRAREPEGGNGALGGGSSGGERQPKGRRGLDVARRGGNRRLTWGSGRGERGGIRNSNPGHLVGASEREMGSGGAGGAGETATWAAWPGKRGSGRLRGGGCGCGSVRRLGEDPTGGPHLSATPGERGGAAGCWAVAFGRPSKGAGGRRKWAGSSLGKKEGEKERKKKRISQGLK